MEIAVPTMAEMIAKGEEPEILFWVGCAGSFDQNAQSITVAFAKILNAAGIKFAILGTEETCTGDPARRSGNEFLFQMMAAQNIQTLNNYNVKKIVTACPHCFNTIKNEYTQLGGNYEVIHHTNLMQDLIDTGRIKLKGGGAYQGKRIVYHDSCYLGRVNGIYEAPRAVLEEMDAQLVEMKRAKKNGLCCGAGGAQMFKEEEKGGHRVNQERTKDVLEADATLVASACPFCKTMLGDGVKENEKQDSIQVKDIAEIVSEHLDVD